MALQPSPDQTFVRSQNTDEDEHAFCEMSAGLGWDPYDLDDNMREQVMELAERLGELRSEAVAVIDSVTPSKDCSALLAAIEAAKPNKLPLPRFKPVTRGVEFQKRLLWDVGYELARSARSEFGLDGKPMGSVGSSATRRACGRSAAYWFLIVHSSIFLRRRFFRGFPPFCRARADLDRPVYPHAFFALCGPRFARTRRKRWKPRFGSAAKIISLGNISTSCSVRRANGGRADGHPHRLRIRSGTSPLKRTPLRKPEKARKGRRHGFPGSHGRGRPAQPRHFRRTVL